MWVWRCHIDLSTPNPDAIERIVPHVRGYDESVFHLQDYVPPGLRRHRGRTCARRRSTRCRRRTWRFSPEDAAFVCDQFGIDVDRPLICQVSRFDPWKDPIGRDRRLPARSRRRCRRCSWRWSARWPPTTPRAGSSSTPRWPTPTATPTSTSSTTSTRSGAIEVNAFQSQADVVIQKSTREGFGLTVSEALWKARPFIGGDVGGIPLQVTDGETGYLVSSPEECADRSLQHPARPRSGQAARPRRQGARAQELPHPPPAAGLAAYLLQSGVTKETPSSSSPTAGRPPSSREGGELKAHAGRRRPGDGAHRPGAPPRGGLGRLGDDRGGRRGQPPARGPLVRLRARRRDLPDQARRVRRGRLRPLLQRGREPDAVVHPALPLGPLQRPGHPQAGDRGLRERLRGGEQGPGRRGARGGRATRPW